ncbi:MAG: hypothetical protein JO281_09195 [Pseudonocardiales bacterium]|nr:hypothetical protein [Pseudonocardiales bacterium]
MTGTRSTPVVGQVEAAHAWWVAQRRPDPDRWQPTVTSHEQRIEPTPAGSG